MSPAWVAAPSIPVVGVMVITASAVLLLPRRGVEGRRSADGHPDAGGPTDDAPGVGVGHRWSALRRRLTDLLGGGRGRAAAEEVLVLDGLAAALEAGLPTGRALHLALDSGDGQDRRTWAWEELWRASGEGQPLAPVWTRVGRRTGSPTMSAVGRAWTVASAAGAPMAAAVRASAEAARERRRLHRAVEVATAGARATGRVMTLLPLAGLGLAAMLGIGPRELYADPLAVGSAGAGVLLLGVGRWVVGRLVAAVVRGVS